MDAKTFWENVNTQIKQQKTTQEWLCKKCNLNIGTMRNRISCNRLPDVIEAFLIAQALNTSVEYLVTGKEPEQTDLKLQAFKAELQKLIDSN